MRNVCSTSSRMRILDFLSRALAMHSSWRCPVLRLPPPSESDASRPSCMPPHRQPAASSCEGPGQCCSAAAAFTALASGSLATLPEVRLCWVREVRCIRRSLRRQVGVKVKGVGLRMSPEQKRGQGPRWGRAVAALPACLARRRQGQPGAASSRSHRRWWLP